MEVSSLSSEGYLEHRKYLRRLRFNHLENVDYRMKPQGWDSQYGNQWYIHGKEQEFTKSKKGSKYQKISNEAVELNPFDESSKTRSLCTSLNDFEQAQLDELDQESFTSKEPDFYINMPDAKKRKVKQKKKA
jgi:hypothetical protein